MTVSHARTGFGYDVHRLVPGRKLILGGVEIDHPVGFEGHSDADVLTHAIIDALLGAAALGDIGKHFPPGAPEYQGISSLNLLAEVRKKLFDNDWTIQNIDATVITEKPRLRDVIDTMREHLSRTLGIHIN